MCKIKGAALLETIYSLGIISVSLVIMMGIFSSIWQKPSLVQKFKVQQELIYYLSVDEIKLQKQKSPEISIIKFSNSEYPALKMKEVNYKKERQKKTYFVIE